MTSRRYRQRTLAEMWFRDSVDDCWEPWMRQADELLDDPQLVEPVYEALSGRWPQSRRRGRAGTPAEVVLRLLVLKHVRNWSYGALEREVKANLVYRLFTRIGAEKVPDAKTLGKIALALGPEVIEQIHQRLVAIAQDKKAVQGKKMRLDTTVVETNIHYPTDSSLLGDGVRVLTRTMKKIGQLAGAVGDKLRDRSRSVQHRLIEIGRSSRSRGRQSRQKLESAYRQLLAATGRVVAQAKRFSAQVAGGVKSCADVLEQAALDGDRQYLDTMIPRLEQVMRQTKQRLFGGDTQAPEKLVSLFEPSTEIIPKGKAAKPTEFGKLVKIQEAENQIITDYQVYDKRPPDADLLLPAIEVHQQRLGRLPRLVAADAGFYSAANEEQARQRGVKRVSIPNRSSRSPERRRHQKKRWFRQAQKWRTGSEGRISLLKRRHGLNRCRYRGEEGMQRWVGLGVIAGNLINIGRHLAACDSR